MTRILLVEDNEQNVYLMRYLLEAHGLEVTVARTGPEALAALAGELPHLVLLDILLPGMDGFEVAQAARARPELAALPIIAVTSYAMAGDRERILAAGCDAYIEKPIDPDTFVAQLRAWLPAGTDPRDPAGNGRGLAG